MAFLERQRGPQVDIGATVGNASVPPHEAPQIDPAKFDEDLVQRLRTRRRQIADAQRATPPISRLER